MLVGSGTGVKIWLALKFNVAPAPNTIVILSPIEYGVRIELTERVTVSGGGVATPFQAKVLLARDGPAEQKVSVGGARLFVVSRQLSIVMVPVPVVEVNCKLLAQLKGATGDVKF